MIVVSKLNVIENNVEIISILDDDDEKGCQYNYLSSIDELMADAEKMKSDNISIKLSSKNVVNVYHHGVFGKTLLYVYQILKY